MTKFFFYFEKLYPTAVFFVAIVTQVYYRLSIPFAHFQPISNALVTIFSIIVGFVFTAVSIMFSVQDRDFMKKLKQSGTYANVVKYHWSSIRWCFSVIVMSIIIMIVGNNESVCPYFRVTLVQFTVSLAVAAVAATFRVVHLFQRIVMHDSSC